MIDNISNSSSSIEAKWNILRYNMGNGCTTDTKAESEHEYRI